MTEVQQVLELLAPMRRRYALYYLDSKGAPVEISELAEAVADMETGNRSVPEKELERFKLSLELHHLKKADNLNFVQYDAEAGEVQLTAKSAEFESLLTVAKVLEDTPDGCGC